MLNDWFNIINNDVAIMEMRLNTTNRAIGLIFELFTHISYSHLVNKKGTW